MEPGRLLFDAHGIAHRVRPELFVLFHRLQEIGVPLLLHLLGHVVVVHDTPLSSAPAVGPHGLDGGGCGGQSAFLPNSGKHIGSYQMPPRLYALIPLSVFSVFFMSPPRLDIVVVSPYRPRVGVYTGKLIGSVQYFLSVFAFLAFSFIVGSPCVFSDPGITGMSAGDSGGGPPRPARFSRPAR